VSGKPPLGSQNVNRKENWNTLGRPSGLISCRVHNCPGPNGLTFAYGGKKRSLNRNDSVTSEQTLAGNIARNNRNQDVAGN
jgi:hypothetical protein